MKKYFNWFIFKIVADGKECEFLFFFYKDRNK